MIILIHICFARPFLSLMLILYVSHAFILVRFWYKHFDCFFKKLQCCIFFLEDKHGCETILVTRSHKASAVPCVKQATGIVPLENYRFPSQKKKSNKDALIYQSKIVCKLVFSVMFTSMHGYSYWTVPVKKEAKHCIH